MPTLVQTVTGKVTALWGTATVRDANGALRELHVGDTVQRGDVVLTSPDGIVQLTPERDAAATSSTPMPPVDGSDELDRVIAGLDQPLPEDAPMAGLAGGGGEGDLQPGLRVDRVVESVTPASVSTSGPERTGVSAPDGTTASREATNQAPTADATARNVAADTPLALALSGRDADGSIRAVTVTTLPANGTLWLADGSAVTAGQLLTPEQAAALTFTPARGFAGNTTIGFTVTDDDGATSAPGSVDITVDPASPANPANPPNAAPSATPAVLTGAEDTPLAVALGGTDADGRIAAVTVTRLPNHGTLWMADGTTPVVVGSPLSPVDASRLVFEPAADFHGDTAVVFTVTDDAGAVSAPDSVSIAIAAVNDAPAIRDDSAATDEDAPLVVTAAALLGNDSDPDGDLLTLVSVQNAVGGSVALVGGRVVFTPAPDFNGAASFNYTAVDGRGNSGTATVTVNVAPVADPAVSIGDVTVDERAGVATFVVTLSEPTTATVSVGYGSTDGSASSGPGASPVDYTAAGGTLTFAPGVTSQTVSVPIGNDRVFEGRETFAVELRTPVNATLGRASGTGTITDDGSGPPSNSAAQPADDDRPVLSVSGGNLVEGGFAVFSVGLSNPSTQPLVFTPALLSGSATVGTDTAPIGALQLSLDGGASWSVVGGDVVVPPNATSVLLRVPTVADGLNEGTETFSLTATPVSGAAPAVAAGNAALIDADGAPALFIDDVAIDEAAGTATFTVSLSSASALPVTVGFSTADIVSVRDGATAGSDYGAVSGTLAFAPGVLRQTITVAISDDVVFEGAERFHVGLSAPVSAAIADGTGTGTIHDDGSGPGAAPGTPADDDTPAVGSVSSPSAVEGNGLDFAVGLTHASTTPTAVLLNVASGSAALGTDTTTPLQVSFDGGRTFAPVAGATVDVPAGAAGFIVRVPTVDDALSEPTESLTLGASTTANASPVTASGSIVDNDGTPALSISGPAVVDEAASTATYTVVLSHASSSTVTVAYGTVDGTATAGQDFSAAAGTLTFAPNELMKTVTVAIRDDAVFEGTESFSLALSAPVGATLAAGGGTVITGIRDDGTGPAPNPGVAADDDTPAVGSVSSPMAIEGGALDFVVGLTHTSTTTTLVALTPASGSATLGTDTPADTPADTAAPLLVSFDGGRTFAPLNGPTVAVPAGAGSFVVRVPTVDDASSEPTETLTLGAATAANPLPVVGQATIIDNDGTPALSISGPAVVDEAAGTATYTVVLSHASSSVVTVAYGTVDGTAVAGQDFGVAAGTLTFAPNELTKTVTVAIRNDAVFEGPESFSLILSAASGATLDAGAGSSASTTIRDDGTGPAPGLGQTADDDTPRIGSVSSPSVVEGGALDFTVALTHTSMTPTVVALNLASGTATVGTDTAGPLQVSFDGGRSFVPVSGATVDVPAGVASFVVRAATVDDAISEPAERLTLSASTPANGEAVIGTGTISDDDATPVLSVSGPAVVDEAAGTATYTVTLSNPSAAAVTVAYGTVDGSAVAGRDFTAGNGTLTFAPNELTKMVTVAITDDAVFEGPESFSLVLSAPSGATLAGNGGTAIVTTSIRDDGTGPAPNPGVAPDDDTPAVGSVSNPTAVEGGALDFVVGLTHASTTPTRVTLAAASGSAALGVDTAAGPLQVSFDGGRTFAALVNGPTVGVPAGIGSFVVRVATLDDLLSEPAETLSLAAATPANAAPVVGTGTIVDNDGTPSLTVDGPAVIDEAAGTATYTVTLSNPSASTVSVGYRTVDGTALAGQDYVAASGTLTFAPNELTKTITVAIHDDAVFEGGETFSLALGSPVGATLAAGSVVSTIRDDGSAPGANPDDDTPTLSLAGPAVIDEAAGTATYTVTLSNPSTGTVSVDYGTVDGTAAAGRDYTAVDGMLTFAPNELTKTITVAIHDDAVFEGGQTFAVSLSAPVGATIGAGSVVSTIRDDGTAPAATPDDDRPTLAISGPAVVDESAGTATYTVTLSNPSTTAVTVGYGTVDGTAVAGRDFTATSGTLTFAAGERTKTVTVAIDNDTVYEGSETFSLALNSPSGATIATGSVVSTIRDDGTAPGLSPDDDTPKLSLTGPAVIDEAAGTATYTVALSNPSNFAVTVGYATLDGTAIAGQDYTAAAGTLTFAPNELAKTITVAIDNDTVYEGSDTFSVALSSPTGATIATGSVVSTIRDDGTASGSSPDNDTPKLSLTGPAVIDEAAGTATYTVALSNPSTAAVTVGYGTVNGTAVAGQDFTATSGTLTFAPNELTKTITVAINNDTVFEGGETFSVALSSPTGATIAAGSVVSTIKDDGTAPGASPDDDTPKLSITGPAVIDEATGTATYTVMLSNPSTAAVTVGYATANGTAVAGPDYTSTSGTLTFAPNELTKTITVAINNDAVFEGREAFSLALGSPSGATVAVGSVVSTIRDDGSAPSTHPDDDTPRLSVTGPAVIDEAAGTATYTVALSNPSTTAVTVGYGTVNGTAVAGQDFTATTGTLTFAPNELTKTITIAIANDTVFEGSETFSVALNSPTGATIAAGTVVSTITDDGSGPGTTTPNDDRPAVGSVSNPTVTEGGNLDFAVHLTHPSTTPTTVALTPSSGSATLGADTAAPLLVSFNGGSTFTTVAGGGTVAVPAGVTDFIVRIATVDDRLIEPTETITLTVSTPANPTAAAVAATGSIVDNEQTFFADAASGLHGEYYGYNESKTTAAGARTHSDDGTATFGNHIAAGNLNSVEDMYTVIDGRNALGGGSASLVGSAASAANNVADVVFNARSIDYGFNPLVSSALGSNRNVAAGSALPAGDGAANSTTRSLENFLDQDRSTAVAQVGAGNTHGGSGLGLTTDAAIRVAGQIYVQPGSYDFRVTADDGFRLNVAGQTLLEYDGNQSPTTRIFNHVQLGDSGGGLQAMELLYWEQGGEARLRIEYKSSNDANGAYKLLDVTNTAMFSSDNAPAFTDPLIQDLVRDDAAGGWRVRTGVALDGTAGNDTLAGTEGRDALNGGAGNDTLNGGGGADTLNGGAGNDALSGGAGSDRLTGGAGADVLTGGSGDDSYVLSDRLDTIVENAAEGYDTVVLDAAYVAANAGGSYTLGANLENLTAEGSAAIDLTGNAADNRLEGNAAANVLDGGAAADVLIGGAGNDRLTGGAGHDVFEWRLADAGTPGAPAVDTITDFSYGGGYSNVQPASGGDVLDLRDLLQGEHTSSGNTGNAAGAVEISNLLNYIDVQVSGADTVLHISKNGGFSGGAFSAGAEDQTIVLQNVNLYSATGVAAGDESSLLKTLIKNGTMVVD